MQPSRLVVRPVSLASPEGAIALPELRPGAPHVAAAHPLPQNLVARTAGEILLVAVLALIPRIFNLLSLPMFLDEATYLEWGQEIMEQKTRAALLIPIIVDGKQPLFMWLAGAAAYLFPDPLMAGRMVSALAGVMSAIGLYLAGYWLAGRRVGLLAGLIYALVPFSLFYDRMALVEALLNMAGIWTFALSVFIAGRACDTRRSVIAGVGLGIALGAAIWTKMPAVFMLAFPFLCALLLSRRGNLAVSARGFAVAAVVFAALATPLLMLPDAGNLWEKAGRFSDTPEALLTFPIDRWGDHALQYWNWIVTYLPAPLWWLVLAAPVWGLVRRTRQTLLLLACWAVFTMPIVLLAVHQYESRYVSQGVFTLLLMLAALMGSLLEALRARARRYSSRFASYRPLGLLAAGVLFLIVMGPALSFDLQLVNTPELAPLAASDHYLFVTGWSAGYGFPETVQLVKQRVAELTKDGQPVIVLGYHVWGHAYAGMKLYLRGMPGVFIYLDSHLARDAEGFMDAWRPHHAPVLIVGNDGSSELDRLDQFERGVPQAKRIGFFPKPTGQSSFRVYEVDAADFAR